MAEGRKRGKAAFLDRDGVINHRLPGAYVTEWGEFSFIRGAVEGMRILREAGYLLIVITNQRGIGRGLMSEEDLEKFVGGNVWRVLQETR